MKIKKVLTKAARQIIKYENFDGGLAQSVERRNHNPCVVGSNPSPATNKLISRYFLYRLLFYLQELVSSPWKAGL